MRKEEGRILAAEGEVALQGGNAGVPGGIPGMMAVQSPPPSVLAKTLPSSRIAVAAAACLALD